jgi:hypothetical protein
MYTDAKASVQINGTLSEPFPINSAIRQGFPLSLVLYAFCLHPFLHMLKTQLAGKFNDKDNFKPVIAFAHDVTILATQPKDIEVINP